MSDWKKRIEDDGIDLNSVLAQLKTFEIETPSWGYANTGTRFGKFGQASAAMTLAHRIEDAGEVHRLTGIAPRMAVHVLWDFPDGFDPDVVELAAGHGLKIGAINPNLFQNQQYKFGSFANPDPAIRKMAVQHCLESIKIGQQVGSEYLSMWFADGTNYPGQDDLVRRRHAMAECLAEVTAAMGEDMTLLLEYKPFEPAFYHTDISDWGAAAMFCRAAGDRAKVLLDTGHHLPGTNVEHIVAILLDEGLLGGFHFNDRKYADDDLTAGSINPYQLFLIFDQILAARAKGIDVPVAYMIDQSHNLKPKLEAMVQSVLNIQELYAKALLVNRQKLQATQSAGDIVAAEEVLRRGFFTDTRPLLEELRAEMGVPSDPLDALRASGIIPKRAAERKADQAGSASFA